MGDFEELIRDLEGVDESQAVRAAHALGDMGDRRATPYLIQALETTNSWRVRNAAAVGLRELADPAALDPLLLQIRDPKNANAYGTLLYALQTLNARSAVVDLASMVCNDEYEGALEAGLAIEAFEGPLTVDDKRKALAILEACASTEGGDEWRSEMVAHVFEAVSDMEESSS